jgi:hypothetical protein
MISSRVVFCVSVCVLSFSQNVCMKLEQYHYQQSCKRIDEKYHDKYLKITQSSLQKNDTLREILGDKFQGCYQKIQNKGKDLLFAFKYKTGVSDEQWGKFRNLVSKVTIHKTEQQGNALVGIIHDEKMPEHFMKILKEQLSSNGIYSGRVNIELRNCYEGSLTTIETFAIDCNTLDIQQKTYAKIAVDKECLQRFSEQEQEALALFLVRDMMREYSYAAILADVANVTINEDEKRFFEQKSLAISLLRCALEKAEHASLLIMFLSSFMTTPSISIDEYKLLAKINYVHQLLAWSQQQ